MTRSYAIFQDWNANKGNFKGRLVMISFRIANLSTKNKAWKLILKLYIPFYQVWNAWFLGIEIHHNAIIGRGLRVDHGQALVVHWATQIGSNCVLRQGTTIGNKRDVNGNKVAGARIGNNVDIGANVCIIGNVVVGDFSVIGAGTILTKSMPEKVVIVGNPARIVKTIS